ncbi:hypothetical protein GCM10010421_32020 [Streptomyces glaucus]|uniref:Secreted protein n=1 Tax=Streptomyces glaucus TaxID=284029 RepID=A0ABP5WYD5_9ACTN
MEGGVQLGGRALGDKQVGGEGVRVERGRFGGGGAHASEPSSSDRQRSGSGSLHIAASAQRVVWSVMPGATAAAPAGGGGGA